MALQRKTGFGLLQRGNANAETAQPKAAQSIWPVAKNVVPPVA